MGRSSLSLQGDCNGLTDRQRTFVAEYTIDFNATRAAAKAGYKKPNVAGRKLIDGTSYPKVARAVGNIQRKNLETAILTKEDIIRELSNYSMLDPIDLCSPGGVFVVSNLAEVPAHVRRCIQSFEVKKWEDKDGNVHQEIKCKIVDKLEAIELLAKHYGMFAPEKHDIRHSIDWDALYRVEEPDNWDVIEGEIAAAGEER